MSEEFKVSYSNVINREDGNNVTKKLANQIMKYTYVNVGNFIRSISDQDLNHLILIGEKCKKEGILTDKDKNDMKEFLLIAFMLKDGEGVCAPVTLESSQWFMNRLFVFLSLEQLSRHRLVKINYDNMSFDTDVDEKTICYRIV